MDAQTQTKPRMTPAEIGLLVKLYRNAMGWSQETLAELSGLTVRTIQRVEAGQTSSLDTRRALARGFEIPDTDVFSKADPFPTSEELEQQKVEFERKHILLDALVADGRRVIASVDAQQGYCAISPGSTVELPHQVQDSFATIVDFVRDCMDVADVVSRREMLEYGDQLETMIADLRSAGFCLCVAVRQTSVSNKGWADQTPMSLGITYVVAAPIDAPPKKIAVARIIN